MLFRCQGGHPRRFTQVQVREFRVVPTWFPHGCLLLVVSDAHHSGARYLRMLIPPLNTWFLWVQCLPSCPGPHSASHIALSLRRCHKLIAAALTPVTYVWACPHQGDWAIQSEPPLPPERQVQVRMGLKEQEQRFRMRTAAQHP